MDKDDVDKNHEFSSTENLPTYPLPLTFFKFGYKILVETIHGSDNTCDLERVSENCGITYLCELCIERMTNIDGVTCQRMIHGGSQYIHYEKTLEDEKPLKCSKCHKSFFCGIFLRISHTNEKPSIGSMCDAELDSSLNEGNRIHLDENNGKCDKDVKQFDSRDLTRQERTEMGGKTYKCAFCEKQFDRNRSLKRHEKKCTGEKPYKCSVCEKSFDFDRNLKRHEKIHTCEKRYKCSVCEKPFQRQSHVKRHEKIHAKEYADWGYVKIHKQKT